MYYLTYEEDMMTMSMANFTNNTSFYPTNTQIDFDKYEMDVLYKGGMDLQNHVGTNSYNVTMTEGVGRWAVLWTALFLLCFM